MHAPILEGIEHAALVGALLFAPLDTSHIGFDAIPIEVQHNTIHRIASLLERVDSTESFLLIVIAITRGDIAESPERGKLLTAGEEGVIGDYSRERAIAIDEIIREKFGRIGGIFNLVIAQIEVSLIIIIDQHAITGIRSEPRHGDAHLGDAWVSSGVAIILTVEHHECITVEAEMMTTFAGAIEILGSTIEERNSLGFGDIIDPLLLDQDSIPLGREERDFAGGTIDLYYSRGRSENHLSRRSRPRDTLERGG